LNCKFLKLEILDLSHNYIADEGGMKIAEMLEKNRSIHTINLEDNNLKNQFVIFLIPFIKLNTKICYIKLSGNIVNEKNMKWLDFILIANRNRIKEKILPEFHYELSKYKNIDKESLIITQEKIKELGEAYKIEKVEATKYAGELQSVVVEEKSKSAIIEKRKQNIDLSNKKIEQTILNQEDCLENEEKKLQKEVENMHKKIEKIITNQEQIKDKSIFFFYIQNSTRNKAKNRKIKN